MTPAQFRRLALSLPETVEGAHMNHPDFRSAGKIFATLAWPDGSWAMVKLTPEQQSDLVHDHPEIFIPVKGAWGRQGSTNVQLAAATADALRPAVQLAWENVRRPKPSRRPKSAPPL
jgi:hypothetical protein